MRIAPAAFFTWGMARTGKEDRALEIVHNVSALTHAPRRSLMGCGIYAFVLWALLENPEKEAIPLGLEGARAYYAQRPEWTGELEHYGRLFRADFSALPRGEIRSSGYVLILWRRSSGAC